MSVDVLAYLRSKGLDPKRASRDNYHVLCPFCNEAQGKRGRLYINVDPDAERGIGLFHCKLCDAKGSIVSLQRHYGDATESQEHQDTTYRQRLILESACAYYQQALDDSRNLEVFRYLTEERGLTVETIDRARLGYAEGSGLFRYLRQAGRFSPDEIQSTGLTTIKDSRQVDFLQHHITIPYIVTGNVEMIRGRAFGDVEDERKYVTGPGQKSRLYNSDAVWDAGEVIVCEGEFDSMVLEQQGFRAVAVPGANTWQESWTGYFDDCRRVWVVFDRDERNVGEQGAMKVMDRLGPKARFVELPGHDHGKSKNDITEFFVHCGHTKQDFVALLEATRGSLVSVKQAVENHAEVMALPGLQFGFPGLDASLHPGPKASQLMVVLANTGVGKTIWLINTFHHLVLNQPDIKILFLSLEQTRADWWERARRIYRFWNLDSTDEDAQAFWQGHIWIDDRNRITPAQFGELLSDFEYEAGGPPDVVAIDYLGYWAQSFTGERYERTSDAVMTLKEMAKFHGLRVIAPHQVSRATTHGSRPTVQASRDSGVVEETADFVLTLWRPDTNGGRDAGDFQDEFKVSIEKSRHGGVGHIESFYLAPLSLAIVPSTDQLRMPHARNERLYKTVMSLSWEEGQIRHLLGTRPEATPASVKKDLDRYRHEQQRTLDEYQHQQMKVAR